MIVIFKSKAAADVIMFGDVAQTLLKIIGKDIETKGIITPEQLPTAIEALKVAIEADRSHAKAAASAEANKQGVVDELDAEKLPAMIQPVSLAQRAVPFLELLEWSAKKNTPVVWGV